MSRITLEGLGKRFGPTVAVDSLDLDIASGEFFSLVGPSGCGKTTTMRMIAGLETPTTGRIVIDDREVFDAARALEVAPARRGVGMVFQSYALWPHMTVYENVAFGLRVRRVPAAEIRERVAAVLERLRIGALGDRYPGELSGGQQQRVALARELVAGARLLLMDEPLSNLDARLRMDMRAELKRLHADTGITIVYVTHDQMEALTLSTRMVVLRDGVVQQEGTPREVYDTPANAFVAEFMSLSQMCFLDGRIEAGAVRIGTHRFRLDAAGAAPDLAPGRPVRLGVRPEHVTLALDAGRPDAVPARVEVSFVAGPSTITQIALDGGEGMHLNAQEPVRRELSRGQRVAFGVAPEHLLLFDEGDGRRLDGGAARPVRRAAP
jgi:multiple sugar transport system ATP-binding protein